MKLPHSSLLLWVLCAGLWSMVVVDKCGGDDDIVAAVSGHQALAAAAGTSFPGDTEPAGKAASGDDACININRASANELVALPGIGPAIAARLVDFREKNGPFVRLADIDKVKGIGPATLRKLEKKVCF